MGRLTNTQLAYGATCRAIAEDNATLQALAPHGSPAEIVTATYRQTLHAEERERLGALLTPDERAAVDALLERT